jgi:hypothetical protein
MNFVANCVDGLVDFFAIMRIVTWYFVTKRYPRMCMEDRSGNRVKYNQPNSVASKMYGVTPS